MNKIKYTRQDSIQARIDSTRLDLDTLDSHCHTLTHAMNKNERFTSVTELKLGLGLRRENCHCDI